MGSNDVRDMSEDVVGDTSSSEEPSGSEEEVSVSLFAAFLFLFFFVSSFCIRRHFDDVSHVYITCDLIGALVRRGLHGFGQITELAPHLSLPLPPSPCHHPPS